MSRRVKVVSYENNIVTLRVDGRLLAYFVDRPQPLGPADTTLLKDAMDTRMLDAMFDLVRPKSKNIILSELLPWKRKDKVPYTCEAIADYIESVGIEIDIDKKGKALVMTRLDVDKIRKGNM